MRSSPNAIPPCGGVPNSSASRKKPTIEDQRLQPGIVNTDAAAADLAPVQDEIVRLRADGARVAGQFVDVGVER